MTGGHWRKVLLPISFLSSHVLLSVTDPPILLQQSLLVLLRMLLHGDEGLLLHECLRVHLVCMLQSWCSTHHLLRLLLDWVELRLSLQGSLLLMLVMLLLTLGHLAHSRQSSTLLLQCRLGLLLLGLVQLLLRVGGGQVLLSYWLGVGALRSVLLGSSQLIFRTRLSRRGALELWLI